MKVLFKPDGWAAYSVDGVCDTPSGMSVLDIPEAFRKYKLNYLRLVNGSVQLDLSNDASVQLVNGEIVPTKETSKLEKWNSIKAERDRRIQVGGYKVGTKWFHSDTFSRTQQMGLVMMGASIPANTPWKTMDGSTVVMTQTLAGQIFATAAGSDIAIFAAAEAHKTAMEASADPAAYDFSTGWPKAFGE